MAAGNRVARSVTFFIYLHSLMGGAYPTPPPLPPRGIGIITLARKRDLIPWNQSLAGKILLPKDLGDDFRLTPISSRLTLRDESNGQDGFDCRGLVCPRPSQLCGDAPLASHGEIASGSMVGSGGCG